MYIKIPIFCKFDNFFSDQPTTYPTLLPHPSRSTTTRTPPSTSKTPSSATSSTRKTTSRLATFPMPQSTLEHRKVVDRAVTKLTSAFTLQISRRKFCSNDPLWFVTSRRLTLRRPTRCHRMKRLKLCRHYRAMFQKQNLHQVSIL